MTPSSASSDRTPVWSLVVACARVLIMLAALVVGIWPLLELSAGVTWWTAS